MRLLLDIDPSDNRLQLTKDNETMLSSSITAWKMCIHKNMQKITEKHLRTGTALHLRHVNGADSLTNFCN